jgi:hypothetical protein
MNIFSTRLRVANAFVKPEPDPFGIRCIGVTDSQAEFPLLLISDSEENDGASATHSMDRVLVELEKQWPEFPITTALVIVVDSMGCFDWVIPQWSEGRERCKVDFRVLRCPPAEPRSKEAFEVLYGDCARAALAELA